LQQHYGFITLLLRHGIAGIAMLFNWNGAKNRNVFSLFIAKNCIFASNYEQD